MVSASPNLLVAASAPSATPAVNRVRRSIISAVSLFRAPDLLQPLIAAAVPTVEFILGRVLQIEILVVVLGLEERAGVDDLGIDRFLQFGLDLRLRGLRQFTLLLAAHKDRRAVLLAAVAELRVANERVDVAPV